MDNLQGRSEERSVGTACRGGGKGRRAGRSVEMVCRGGEQGTACGKVCREDCEEV